MDSDVKFVLALLLATVIITGFLTASTVVGLAHREAVKQGCAQYSPKTGKFEWITREVINSER
jgi:hypothetical protein